MRLLPRLLREATGLALAVAAGGAWFLAASRLMVRAGAPEAAEGVGMLAWTAVSLTLWRFARRERETDALAAGHCPRCAGRLAREHEHARPGLSGGLVRWECVDCGEAGAEALTCEQCRSYGR